MSHKFSLKFFIFRLRLLALTSIVSAYPPGFAGYFNDFPQEPASSRFLLGAISIPGGKSAMGSFGLDAAKSYTVEGMVTFTQNFFSGQNSRYTAHLRGVGMEGKKYEIGFADDCAGTNYKVYVWV